MTDARSRPIPAVAGTIAEGAVVGMLPSDASFRTLHFGLVIGTADPIDPGDSVTVWFSTQAERNNVMCRSMNHLGVACP